MKLHLLRHAKTKQSSASGLDFERKLLPKGIKQSKILNQFLAPHIKDAEIWCSDAYRTKETLSIIEEGVSLSKPQYFNQLYLASRDEILQMIWNNPSNKDLLIVGHNFGISEVASYFLDEPITLKTAEYIQLKLEGSSWQETSRGLGTMLMDFRPQVD